MTTVLFWIAGLALAIAVLAALRAVFTRAGRARLMRRKWFARFVEVFVDGLISAVVGAIFNAVFGGSDADDDRRRSSTSRRGTFDGGGASGDW